MKAETGAKIKYGSWGVVCGAVVAMIVGFGWGGWTTAGTTNEMSGKAVVASQAAVCVAQFTKQPNHAQKLKEFEEASTWTRPDFIEKGGWDKMPGQDTASSGVARACADGVALLTKK
ncbi:MAG TPA: hypothetical protein VK548_29445 [Candidatus Acidoferrum sp.]|nr:hypothetical protein [Candidatus Acidoferrum sp.]